MSTRLLHGLCSLVLLFAAGCSEDGAVATADADHEMMGEQKDAGDARRVERTCTGFFGTPTESTGLTSEVCNPTCDCNDGSWTAPNYGSDDIVAIEEWTLENPPDELDGDPYMEPGDREPRTDAVCAFVPVSESAREYRLETFDSLDAAAEADGTVTHFGACGVCSSLTDLAVYMRNSDLTGPVRECGLKGLTEGKDSNMACLMEIGFTKPCAQIWYYNTVNTRNTCLDKCLSNLDSTYHVDGGQLNPCIECDERESGPVFKAVAGRTRRGSGLPSALCRPCESIRRVEHRYP